MSKPTNPKTQELDLSRFSKSTFTLTFAVEIVGIQEWENSEQGWTDLGPCVQGMKIQYSLLPGHTCDLDILIWPHVAKIWCGPSYGWVRVWQFLERRWFTCSIRHALPVRVLDFQDKIVTVTTAMGVGSLGVSAKNDKEFNVCIPPLQFGERRYFAPVLERDLRLAEFMKQLIWSSVEEHIPPSFLDGLFDIPQPVFDVRHQDASLYHVREIVLKRESPKVSQEDLIPEPKAKSKKPTGSLPSSSIAPKAKFEIFLTGHNILAGIGRVIPFKQTGEKPADLGEIIVLISTNNLPASDDYPVVFVNVDGLCEVPVNEFKDLGITELYTRWQIDEHVHDSKPIAISYDTDISFEDHHAIPLPYDLVSKVMIGFNEEFEIQLRGKRIIQRVIESSLFGYKKDDRDFDVSVPKLRNTDTDFLIAVTKIHTIKLAKGLNTFLRGEFPLYPPKTSVRALDREGVCTNDINGIRIPVEPDLVVKPDLILLAQMTLEVSVGLVGCKTKYQSPCFSRMFCLIKDSNALMSTLRYITTINEEIHETEDSLTGFALDTGDVAFLYVEGPKDGHILRVWDMTEDYYPILKPVFSCTVKYSSRIYPELLAAEMPFSVLKMFVPLGVLLACPPVYTRPALPLPTRAAVLKIGRLLASKLEYAPSRSEMPTGNELKSLRLELCVAPRPLPVHIAEKEQQEKIREQKDEDPTGIPKLKVSMAKI